MSEEIEKIEKKKKKVSKADAIAELWEKANLSYKLIGKQSEIYKDIKNASKKISVIAASRRLGKSYLSCLCSVELCLTKKNAIIKYVCPTQAMVKNIILPIMRQILEDCPPYLRPEWKEADKRYTFPNGSEIQIAGVDNDRADTLRGGSSDLCIVDEAAFCSDLQYVISSVLLPTTATTKGKIILASTPNYKDPQHVFNTNYMIPYEESGDLKKYTIKDNPLIDEETLQSIIASYPRGEEDPAFRCEYYCEVSIDQELMVIPEFDSAKANDITRDTTKPQFFHAYISMDVGFKDLTGVLFAYVDFDKSALVIADELVIHGPTLTTDFLATEIKRKENEIFMDKNDYFKVEPALRVMDNNNLVLLNDLFRLHGINFIATAKDNKEAQINELRLLIKQNRLIISPKCKTLIFHLKNAKWDKQRKQFTRLKDSPDGTLKGGHADLLDALIYLVRNVRIDRNPYPDNWGELVGESIFRGIRQDNKTNELQETLYKLLNIKPKK